MPVISQSFYISCVLARHPRPIVFCGMPQTLSNYHQTKSDLLPQTPKYGWQYGQGTSGHATPPSPYQGTLPPHPRVRATSRHQGHSMAHPAAARLPLALRFWQVADGYAHRPIGYRPDFVGLNL